VISEAIETIVTLGFGQELQKIELTLSPYTVSTFVLHYMSVKVKEQSILVS